MVLDLSILGINDGNKSAGVTGSAAAKEIDIVISSSLDAIEKEMILQQERVEQRDGDLRQMLTT